MIEIFEPGTIFNPLKREIKTKKLVKQEVLAKVPARINAMVFDTASLVKPDKKGVYTAGELIFSAKLYTYAKVKINKSKSVCISKKTMKKSVVLHSALLMKKAINFKEGLTIEANNTHDYSHCGFGSTAALQVAVAIAINKLYNSPLKPKELMKFLSQNYGEEIESEDKKLIHVQSNGGGLAVALYNGGMLVLAGEAVVIKRVPFPQGYYFVFGIPKSYKSFDAKIMMEKEEKIFPNMQKSSNLHSREIAWNVLHILLPALVEKRMSDVGKIVEKYRFESGSLENDGQMWPEMLEKMNQLRKFINPERMPILSTSSCGPAIFSLTKKPREIKEIFEKYGLESFIVETDNKGTIID